MKTARQLKKLRRVELKVHISLRKWQSLSLALWQLRPYLHPLMWRHKQRLMLKRPRMKKSNKTRMRI